MKGCLIVSAVACLAVSIGCEVSGEEGARCIHTGGIIGGSYRCNGDLVCDTTRDPPICEVPHTHDVGEPCEDGLCKEELFCSVGPTRKCTVRRGEGEPCPGGFECEHALRCVKELILQLSFAVLLAARASRAGRTRAAIRA